MQIDIARVVWLLAHGGIYADLDTEALRNAAPYLENASIVLFANDTNHAKETGCMLRKPLCGTHMSNLFMAGVAGHPFWWELLNYATRHVDDICSDAKQQNLVHRVPELTGPFAVGRAYERFVDAHPRLARGIRVLPRQPPFFKSKSEGGWLKKRSARVVRNQSTTAYTIVAVVATAVLLLAFYYKKRRTANRRNVELGGSTFGCFSQAAPRLSLSSSPACLQMARCCFLSRRSSTTSCSATTASRPLHTRLCSRRGPTAPRLLLVRRPGMMRQRLHRRAAVVSR
jgi:hypothetical protein